MASFGRMRAITSSAVRPRLSIGDNDTNMRAVFEVPPAPPVKAITFSTEGSSLTTFTYSVRSWLADWKDDPEHASIPNRS